MKVKLLSDGATAPVKGSVDAAGYDLFALEECVVRAGGRAAVKTGIAIAIPRGFYGRIAPRSGLAVKHGIDVLAGVVDSDYRGEVVVCLYNTGSDDYTVAAGDKCAQLIIESCRHDDIEVVDELTDTDRGEGGFGSTGY